MDQSADHSRKRNILAGAGLALLLCGTQVPAQQPAPAGYKIGFVDAERVLRDSRASQDAQKSMDADFRKREQEIGAGPQEERQRRGYALAEEMNQRRDDQMKLLIDKTNVIIRRLAEADKLDAVFLEAAYASTRIDMTDAVIKALDAAR